MALGTAGPIGLLDQINNPFIMLNGDVLSDFNFRDFLKFHNSSKNLVTVGVFNRTDSIPLGVLKIDKAGNIIEYVEKPKVSNFVSMGIYAMSPEILRFIPRAQKFDMPTLVSSLIEKKLKVGSYLHEGFWLDIGNHEDYAKAQDEIDDIKPLIFGQK